MEETDKGLYLMIGIIFLIVVYPIAMDLMDTFGNILIVNINGTQYSFYEVANPNVVIALLYLVPVLIIVAIIMYFIPKN